jgi:hypothetical protein
VVGAVGAGELHAPLDACDGVQALHNFECSLLAPGRKARGLGSEGNEGAVSKWENVPAWRLGWDARSVLRSDKQ